MTYQDLTPELLKQLYACASAEDIIAVCAAKDLAVSGPSAKSLMEKFEKVRGLGEEHLEKVVGGAEGYVGTRKLTGRMDQPVDECPWDVGCEDCYFYDRDCWDNNGDNIDDDLQFPNS